MSLLLSVTYVLAFPLSLISSHTYNNISLVAGKTLSNTTSFEDAGWRDSLQSYFTTVIKSKFLTTSLSLCA